MRLWHKSLIPVLPREQLVAQWRELSAIAGAIQKNGTPNHILVNFVTEYTWSHFVSYAKLVRDEMTKRGYRTSDKVWEKICSVDNYSIITPEEDKELNTIFYDKMDDVYLTICYYNLYEKFLCGGISKQDWDNICLKVLDSLCIDNRDVLLRLKEG